MRNLKFIRLLCALGALGFPGAGQSQTVPTQPDEWVIRSWGTDAGLPQNTVSAIAQTPDGYLWLGTREGLARFDGVRFTVFGFNRGLKADGVTALLVTRDGTLWIGSNGGSFGRWVNGEFVLVPGLKGDNAEQTVNCFAEDPENRLWIGTLGGLRIWQAGQYVEIPGARQLEELTIVALQPDGKRGMWVLTGQEDLFHYGEGRLSKVPYPEGISRRSGYCLVQDRQGRLWVGMGNGKILCRSEESWRTYSEAEGVPFSYVGRMAEDVDGTIWAGSFDAGLYYFTGDRFTAIRQERSLSAGDIRSLKPDREGNLWVGTRTGGLNRVRRGELTHYGKMQGLTNEFVRSVAESEDGTLWVATSGGGIYKGGPQQGFTQFLPGPEARFYAHPETVLVTPNGSLWWGGPNSLLRWKDDKLDEVSKDQWWGMGPAILSLCNDGHGGIWFGNSIGNLIHFTEDRFLEFPKQAGWRAISALAMETNNCLWVGTSGGGLWFVNPGKGEVRAVSSGLSSQYVRTLYRDTNGVLWVGTVGGGLSRIKQGAVANFTAEQGLQMQTVSQIVEDDNEALWLGCSRGIAFVRKKDLDDLAEGREGFIHPRIYGPNDGMPSAECTGGFSPAGLKTKAGLICISTVKGLVFIDPRNPRSATPYPKVMVEEVLVNGQLRELQRLQEAAVGSDEMYALPTEQLILQPGDSELELRYTGISFAAPEKVSFRYKLEGLDERWVEAGSRRAAYYHRLPPGDYTFRVIACNAEGLWNEIGAALAVVQRPHIWETHWFTAGVGVAVLGVIAGSLWLVQRRRYRARLALLKTQHAIERERVRIAQDMHDNVGAMLTQVSQLSDLGQGQAANPAVAKGHFERIGVQARTAVQALDEIVWATNPKNDNLPRFADYVSRFADEFFETSSVRCWQEMPTHLPAFLLSADLRHNVFLALKEAFHNIVKHSGAEEMWLRLVVEESQVRLEIEDNGRGFDPVKTGDGDGLGNMRSRMAECGGRVEIDSAPGRGTRIRLGFPVSLALTTD